MAEFVEVMTQAKRICAYYKNCSECPIRRDLCNDFQIYENMEQTEETIMDWAKEHPVQTNADKFEEVFGFEPITSRCIRKDICAGCEEYGTQSKNCMEDWWNEEYKAPTEGRVNNG